ncbi:hypothetical protein MMPV_006576 [Pyropia vietnamensis]
MSRPLGGTAGLDVVRSCHTRMVTAYVSPSASWQRRRALLRVAMSTRRGPATTASSPPLPAKVDATAFYRTYSGHTVEHLAAVHAALIASDPDRPVIWLLGDSTLDNKYWVPKPPDAPALNGYERALEPPRCVQDVAYHLNAILVDAAAATSAASGEGRDGGDGGSTRPLPPVVINAAVEASTIAQRSRGRLLAQDKYVRDHLRPADTLIVSVGGNDVALAPTLATAVAAVAGVWFNNPVTIDANPAAAWGIRPLLRLFRDDTASYIRQLVGDASSPPARVIVCGLYYPATVAAVAEAAAEAGTGAPPRGWADLPLRLLRYNERPGRMQACLRALYRLGTCAVTVPNVAHVVPVALYERLDGTRGWDYVERVEPSVTGGRVLAEMLAAALQRGGTRDLAA